MKADPRPLLAQVQLAIAQTIVSLQGTHLGAFVTGKESLYEAMHQGPPDFTEVRKPHPHAQPEIVRTFSAPVFHPGASVVTPLDRDRSLAIPNPKQGAGPAFSRRNASVQPLRRARNSPRSTMSVGANNGSGTTGMNHWWTYEEGGIPGAGKWMGNVATGNLLVQDVDVDIPERGIDLAFQRTYNSQSQHDYANTDGSVPSNFGDGWTNTFDTHIAFNTGLNAACPSAQGITLYDIDGARYDFTPNCAGGYSEPAGLQGTQLQSYGNGCVFEWTKKNGTTYGYYSPAYSSTTCSSASYAGYNGRLWRIWARNNNDYIKFDYYWSNSDSSNPDNISTLQAIHSDGQAVTLTFGDFTNASGTKFRELASITRPDSQVITFKYDNTGRNLAEVDEAPNGSNNNVAIPVQYSYWSGDLLETVQSPLRTESGGYKGSYVWFNFNTSHLLSAVQLYGWSNFTPDDGSGQPLQPSYSQGNQQISYTSFAYPSSTETQMVDADGHAENWFFDSLGRVTTTQEYAGAQSGLWLQTTSGWDANNDLTDSTDPRGNATYYAYDSNGNTVAVAAPSVATSAGTFRPTSMYSYDARNNVIAFCDPVYTHQLGMDWVSNPGSSDNLCPNQAGATRYVWDLTDSNQPYGRLTDTYTAMGYHHAVAYNTSSQGGGDYGLPTDVTGDCISQSDGTQRCPHLEMMYDGYGNVTCYSTFQDGNGAHWSRATYDGLNRRTATADSDDASLTVASCSNASGIPGVATHIQSSTAYYPNGQVQTSQSPSEYAAGVSSSYSYDADGNLTSSTSHTGGVAGTTTKWYDGADRLVEVQQPTDGADVYGFPWRTRYIYDLSQNGTNARPTIGGQTLIGYGNLVVTQECLASTTVTAPYASKPTSCTFTNMETKGQTFDALDRLYKKYSWSGNALYTETLNYDATGQAGLLSTDCKTSASLNTPCTSYSYTTLGQIAAVAHGDGQATPDFTYTYDPDGRTTSVAYTANGSAQTYAYDQDGRVTQSVEPNTINSPATLTYHYYADGMRQSIDVASSALNQSGLFQYSYREDGKLQTQQINTGFLASANTTLHFGYSIAGRELSLTYSGSGAPVANPSYVYDAQGRETSQSIGSTNMTQRTFDPEGELTSYVLGGQATAQSLSYTTRGEIVNQPPASVGYVPPAMYANGLRVNAGSSTVNYETIATSTTFDARMGAVQSWAETCTAGCGTTAHTNPCVVATDGTFCPNDSFTYDGLGRMTQKVDVTYKKDDTGASDELDNTTNAAPFMRPELTVS